MGVWPWQEHGAARVVRERIGMSWWRLRGVRARTTLSATVVVAVALALAGAGLVVL